MIDEWLRDIKGMNEERNLGSKMCPKEEEGVFQTLQI